MNRVVLKVPTIDCGSCIETIRRALMEESGGVTKVEGDLRTREVKVSFVPGEITAERIREAIIELGHEIGEAFSQGRPDVKRGHPRPGRN